MPIKKTTWNKKQRTTEKKRTMTRRRKKCVDIAKKIAKIRDKYICQHCLKVTSGHDCQGSHVIAESKSKVLSCDPLNIKVLCYRCHKDRRHLCPTESGIRFRENFPERYDYLSKINQRSEGSIGMEYFKEEFARLKQILSNMDGG